jgi:AGCS family alanine or glycine:cation symporter
VILVTDVWQTSEANGVTLTNLAFESSLGWPGKILLLTSAFFFAITSLFSFSYYGNKAMSFLFGVKSGKYYDYVYLVSIVFAAIVPMLDIINIIDISFALMAIPTMLSAIMLAPRVMKEAREYFQRIDRNRRQ